MNAAASAEAQRQQALLAALGAHRSKLGGLALRDAGAGVERGLAAYRANAHALAERALADTFPTVQAMLGEADFAQLARAHRHAHAPTRGDLGEWGDALPAALEANTDLAAWPWLADCARLDLALHRCERAADDRLDAASLQLLGTHDPAQLSLVTGAGLAVLVSEHPIVTIHAAHQQRDDAGDAFAPVRAALAAGHGETACVARQGWRAVVQRVDAGSAGWLQALLAGVSLAEALQRAGPAFDLAAALASALAQGWVRGARACDDPL